MTPMNQGVLLIAGKDQPPGRDASFGRRELVTGAVASHGAAEDWQRNRTQSRLNREAASTR